MTDQPIQRPTIATDAVLRPSDPVSDGARQVKGVEFDDFRERDMTVKEMVTGMASMGFQASAVADAVRIINDMVRTFIRSFGARISWYHTREYGENLKLILEPRFSWATLLI